MVIIRPRVIYMYCMHMHTVRVLVTQPIDEYFRLFVVSSLDSFEVHVLQHSIRTSYILMYHKRYMCTCSTLVQYTYALMLYSYSILQSQH